MTPPSPAEELFALGGWWGAGRVSLPLRVWVLVGCPCSNRWSHTQEYMSTQTGLDGREREGEGHMRYCRKVIQRLVPTLSREHALKESADLILRSFKLDRFFTLNLNSPAWTQKPFNHGQSLCWGCTVPSLHILTQSPPGAFPAKCIFSKSCFRDLAHHSRFPCSWVAWSLCVSAEQIWKQ